jgi:hypothetical protein
LKPDKGDGPSALASPPATGTRARRAENHNAGVCDYDGAEDWPPQKRGHLDICNDMRLTQIELCDLAAKIANEMPRLVEGTQ